MGKLSEAMPVVRIRVFTDMLEEVGLVSPFKDGCIKETIEKLESEMDGQ